MYVLRGRYRYMHVPSRFTPMYRRRRAYTCTMSTTEDPKCTMRGGSCKRCLMVVEGKGEHAEDRLSGGRGMNKEEWVSRQASFSHKTLSTSPVAPP